MEDRKKTEADFHDKRAIDQLSNDQVAFEKKYPNKRLYVITLEHRKRIDTWISNNSSKDTKALDYCCGEGEGAIKMASAGCSTYGIDISNESLEIGRKSAIDKQLNINFKVMDAENLEFDDEYFDLIYAAGCFHHLDLDKTYSELHRVLKKNGEIICNESLAHNPIFHLYRKMTPNLRTPWEVPHILKVSDVYKAKKYFSEIDIRYHYLISIIAVPFSRTFIFKPLLGILSAIDKVILSIPYVNRLAWQCTFVLSKPKKNN